MSMESAIRELTEYRRQTERELECVKHALNALNGTGATHRTGQLEKPAGNVISAAARRKMSLAQKARWQKQRQGVPGGQSTRSASVISIAGRRRISLAQKARWAKLKRTA
jgi:hypothetical protein